LGIAAINTVAIIAISGVPIGIGLGLFAGSFTSSPALVSALQYSSESEVIFGYGVAYPFGLMAVILFITIAMQLLKGRMQQEVAALSQMSSATYRMENPDIHGKLLRDIAELNDHDVVVSAILREHNLRTASGSTVLLQGDVLRLEGRMDDLEMVGQLLGSPVEEQDDTDSELDTRSIVVENTGVVNRSLNDLGIPLLFNVALTRVVRNNVEFVPRDDLVLAYGDTVMAVATPYQLEQLEMYLGHEHHSVQRRVDIGSLAATLFLAFAIGGLVIPIPILGSFSLGIAGGALISGLLFGHFGRIGNFIGRFPRNATAVLKELGLALFFAQLGFETGQSFVEMLDYSAIYYAVYAVLLAVVPMAGSFLAGHYLLKIPVSECFGVICGGMTFTPGLDVIRQNDDSERPVVAYSSVYPVALIMIIMVVQGMYLALNWLQAAL
jgi:putative transport protein